MKINWRMIWDYGDPVKIYLLASYQTVEDDREDDLVHDLWDDPAYHHPEMIHGSSRDDLSG